MADISFEDFLVNRSQAIKIRGRMSLKEYCLTDTKDEAENERRKRLLEEYSEKNKESIEKVSYGSGKRVWWKCQECGYEWGAPPSWRTGKDKCGCAKCAGKIVSERNSLLSYIEKNGAYGEKLRKEYSKENKLGLDEICYGTRKRILWNCSVCKKIWEASPNSRTGIYKSGCPYCASKIVSERNSLLSFIEKNGAYGERLKNEFSSKNEKTLSEIAYSSNKKVFWKCSICKKEWMAPPNNRTGTIRRGCPFCAGKIVSERNSLLSFIEANGKYGEQLRKEYSQKNKKALNEISYGTNEKALWKCSVCKKEWETSVSSRTGVNKTCCPYCNRKSTSFPEQLIFYILKRELPNYEVFNRDTSEGREIDVYIPSLKFGVEYDGWLYHKERQDKDKEKYQFFQERELDIIRIVGKKGEESIGVNCDLEYNINKDRNVVEARNYIKNYLYEHYNIEIDISMTSDEIEECKREARKQIENTLGGFSLDELDIPEESEEEFEYLPAYL